ncbi:tRNA-U20-dihydrouridine synthase [Hasllibacter halocynthiae]|uniref:tRNA-dihydrouridine synthase n=1 Tax=Hasllibacter halocynthiae TaxID=595589 RepID=A0A2T0X894_9RHOB|nr:tRNA dihydrouridine synthase DusB [Hasllibacter halocynthiae]PRY95172.1 tRNA-U20-dihydrouridine synthase [Hasllibacter halocynthiae]
MRIGSVELKGRVLLAPMAGITDLPFRRLVRRFGVALTTSEMIASGEFLTRRPGTREKAELEAEGGAVQLAGREPGPMAEAARAVAGMGARIVDINMGCPAKKVTGGASGSALMREPDRALRLVEAVVGAVDVPVTVKMRLGWDERQLNAPALARRAEAAGAQAIAVHGRTRCQFYRGTADWDAIAGVVRAVSVPVIANGDVIDAAAAGEALRRSGAAAVMVGRGAQGAPWMPAAIEAGLAGHAPPRFDAFSVTSEHYEAILAFYGAALGHRVARKHLGWAMDRAGTPLALRRAVLTAPDPAAVRALLPGALSSDLAA